MAAKGRGRLNAVGAPGARGRKSVYLECLVIAVVFVIPAAVFCLYVGAFRQPMANMASGQVLVVNQRGRSWSLPKGHIEKGESILEAARREIYEESGVKKLKFVRN